ncbi:MAG: hypothetical protein LAO78_15910 [Acidobacteriia bacterium]|nr:hypothetical protein [Terriglobia bacterium]
MLRRLCIIILCALTLMAVVSPLLQFDSLDSFPVSSDDIELLVMFCLCLAGMMLLFAHLFKLVPVFFRVLLLVPPRRPSAILLSADTRTEAFAFINNPPPLRI